MKRQGFTLVELLIVIAIIGTLAAMVFSGAARAMDMVEEAECRNNLSQIGKSANIYAAGHSQVWPDLPTGTWSNWDKVGSSRGDQYPSGGTYPATGDITWDTAPDSSGDPNSNTANLWILIANYGMMPKQFVCPSADAHEVDQTVTEANRGELTDFRGDIFVSYSYQNVFGRYRLTSTVDSPQSLAVAADANPQRRDYMNGSDGATDVKLNEDPAFTGGDFYSQWNTTQDTITEAFELNSPNHGFSGQNVLYVDGHVAWTEHPYVGPSWDNIWIARDQSATGDIIPSDLASLQAYNDGGTYDGSSTLQAGAYNDSFLVP